MKTVKEIADQTGVSVRTLHHYDAIGLLKPTQVTQASYRLYDDAALERLYLILLFRELGFPLKEIREILDAPDYDRNHILQKQIGLLTVKVTHLQNCIHLATELKRTGAKHLKFDNWDPNKIDDHTVQAEMLYGRTDAWQEYTQKSSGRSQDQEQALGDGMMALFAKLGGMKELPAGSREIQAWVKALQDYLTEHFYNCTPRFYRDWEKCMLAAAP